MLSWFRREKAPTALPTNPGRSVDMHVTLAGAHGTRHQHLDVIGLASEAIRRHGHEVRSHRGWLTHPATGFTLLPQLVDLVPLEDGGARTVTTLQAVHPSLIPEGVFDFQHGVAGTATESLLQGFEQ